MHSYELPSGGAISSQITHTDPVCLPGPWVRRLATHQPQDQLWREQYFLLCAFLKGLRMHLGAHHVCEIPGLSVMTEDRTLYCILQCMELLMDNNLSLASDSCFQYQRATFCLSLGLPLVVSCLCTLRSPLEFSGDLLGHWKMNPGHSLTRQLLPQKATF